MRSRYPWMLIALTGCAVASCAHYPINAPLAHFEGRDDGTGPGYRFSNFRATEDAQGRWVGDAAAQEGGVVGNSDDLFVVVALSGGGARAAAFSYGLLEELQRTRIRWHGHDKSLLDEVDVISSVSGSSFTAAYYAWRHEKTFEEFPQRFLYKPIQAEFTGAVFNPLNWPRLASPTFDRVDLAAELYDQEVFKGVTFGELTARHQRPYLVLNSAEISRGTRFEFTQEQFDFLYSDVGSIPLARAVAASAAFPVVLSPIAFENYPKGPDFREPAWVRAALDAESPAEAVGGSGRGDAKVAARSPRVVRRAADLRLCEDASLRPHIRLLDGALADYMGLRSVMQSLLSEDGDWSLRRMADQGRIRKLVIISLNSVRTPEAKFDRLPWAPGIADVLYLTAASPIRNNAFDTTTVMQDLLAAEGARRKAVEGGEGKPEMEITLVPIDFSSIHDTHLRERAEGADTAMSLDRLRVDDLRRGAGEALRDSAPFQQLLKGLR